MQAKKLLTEEDVVPLPDEKTKSGYCNVSSNGKRWQVRVLGNSYGVYVRRRNHYPLLPCYPPLVTPLSSAPVLSHPRVSPRARPAD